MCGIWGVVNRSDEGIAEQAVQAMQHRGPDDCGTFIMHEPVPAMLGSTRLSIIDLSEAGHMPMTEPTGRYQITYNGEVYNFAALRTLLEDMGHRFHSGTDTEVILRAYMEWGPNCLHHFRGMFAFAILDTHTGELFAARDRLGIKPLYYVDYVDYSNRERSYLAFASEIKALVASGMAERRLNYAALHHYLSFYAVPAPHTIIADVKALPAGHYLTYRSGTLRIEQYWDLPPAAPLDMSEEEMIEQLWELLYEAIRLRMIADVPVGAFLSGGVDSAAIVALMTRASGERLRTFSIGFGDEGRRIDERSAARAAADRYNTIHTEVVVTGEMVRDQIGHIINAMDQPTGDGLNTYFVSQATSNYVKVALSGVGGDELFAGYPQFRMFQRADRIASAWNRLPQGIQNLSRRAGALVGPLGRAISWLEGDLLERYERVRVLYSEEAKADLYTDLTEQAVAAPEPSMEYLQRFVHPSEQDRSIVQLMRLELKNYMAHTLLRDTDVMSMAHSLEVRVPLIDHKLVEFAGRIPPGLKLRDGRGKWIFTRVLEDMLPDEVLKRPKRGFEMPVASWMRGPLRSILEDVFSERSLQQRGMFKVEPVRAIYREFIAGRSAIYMRAWSLAVLELWLRATIDDQPIH